MDQGFADDLADWLKTAVGDTPKAAERYAVERVIRQGPTETTEVVRREDGLGPFIRKTFAGQTSRGSAYQRLLAAQVAGMHLLHVPFVYECVEHGEDLQVVCEYVLGESLRELAEHGEAGVEFLRRVYPGLCDAVTELHTTLDVPMIHRDIKPSNVIVGSDRVALIDFGIARDFAPGAARDTVRYGTPGYAPPEQFGYGQTSAASDIYALGMTLAFCLTGEDPTPTLRENGFEDERIPVALRPILAQATAFDPQDRYESAEELRRDLDRALGQALPLPTRREVSRVTSVLGRIWNLVVVALWGLVVSASVLAIIDPTPENAQYPFWFLVLEYVGFVMVPGSAVALALLDKRRIRQHVALPVLSIPKTIAYTVAFVLACWLFSFLVYAVAVYPFT